MLAVLTHLFWQSLAGWSFICFNFEFICALLLAHEIGLSSKAYYCDDSDQKGGAVQRSTYRKVYYNKYIFRKASVKLLGVAPLPLQRRNTCIAPGTNSSLGTSNLMTTSWSECIGPSPTSLFLPMTNCYISLSRTRDQHAMGVSIPRVTIPLRSFRGKRQRRSNLLKRVNTSLATKTRTLYANNLYDYLVSHVIVNDKIARLCSVRYEYVP